MRNRQQGAREYPSPLVGEDRTRAKPERGGGSPGPNTDLDGGGRLRGRSLSRMRWLSVPGAPPLRSGFARVGSPPQGGRGRAGASAAMVRRRWADRSRQHVCFAAVALWSFVDAPRPARPLGGREALDRGARSRRAAAAALRDRGRALATAGRGGGRRSALPRHAQGLRGPSLRPSSRHRSAGAAARRGAAPRAMAASSPAARR